ncbi:MAG: hypothetical protein HOI95_07025 [Chromatiales bacterium]|nr:hypothetical protein [Chromatiales bacterium]
MALVRPFLALSVLRASPKDLPHSTFLLGLTVVTYLAVNVVTSWLVRPPGEALLLTLTEIALVFVLVPVTLAAYGFADRIAQTLTAMFGASIIIAAASLPLALWMGAEDNASAIRPDHQLALLVLTAWVLTVQGNILRHALSTGFGIGLAFSFAFFWITLHALQMVYAVLNPAAI